LDPLGISEGPKSFTAANFDENDEKLIPTACENIPGKSFDSFRNF